MCVCGCVCVSLDLHFCEETPSLRQILQRKIFNWGWFTILNIIQIIYSSIYYHHCRKYSCVQAEIVKPRVLHLDGHTAERLCLTFAVL